MIDKNVRTGLACLKANPSGKLFTFGIKKTQTEERASYTEDLILV